jgi:O-antigen/teichoic acid export membrane protein
VNTAPTVATSNLVGTPVAEPVRAKDTTASRTRTLILARGASAVMTFFIPLVLARMLPTTEYGTYKQFVLVAQTLYAVLPFGMAQSLYYFLPRGKDRRAYLGQTHAFVGMMAVLAAVALVLFAVPLARQLGNPELSHLRVWLALYAAGLLASLPFEITFTARGKTGFAAATYLVSDFVRTAVMTLPVLLGFGLTGLCVGLAAWATARWGATLLLTMRGEPGPSFNKAAWREQVKYALPFGAAMAVAVPQNYFHQYAVSASVDAAAFAVYSVGCFQLPLVDLLYMPTTEILMVRIGELDAEGRVHEGAKVFREASSRLLLLFVPMAFFLFSAAPDFVPALFSEKYLSAVPVFRIALWAILLAGVPVDGALRARKATGAIFQSYVVKALVAVPLVLVGLHYLGIYGAILAWVAGEAVGKALLLSRLPKAMNVTFGELMPWKSMAQALAGAVLAAGCVVAFEHLAPASRHVTRMLCECAIFGVAYAAGLAAVGGNPVQVIGSFVKR